MLDKLINNMSTIIILIILAVIVYFIIKKLINDKKAGKSSCGNNCAHCAMAGKCHPQSKDK